MLPMPVHSTRRPGCFQWGGHGHVYCGRGARDKAAAQGRAAYSHGYRGHARSSVTSEDTSEGLRLLDRFRKVYAQIGAAKGPRKLSLLQQLDEIAWEIDARIGLRGARGDEAHVRTARTTRWADLSEDELALRMDRCERILSEARAEGDWDVAEAMIDQIAQMLEESIDRLERSLQLEQDKKGPARARIVVGEPITYDLPHPTGIERRGSHVLFRDERGLWNVVVVDAQGLVARVLLEGGSRTAARGVWDAAAGERAAATRAVVPQPPLARYGPQPSGRGIGPTPARGGWRQIELRVKRLPRREDLAALGLGGPPSPPPYFVIYKMEIGDDGKVKSEVLRDHASGEPIWYSGDRAAQLDAITFAEAYAAQQPRNPNAIRVLDLSGRCIFAVVGMGREVSCAEAPALGTVRRVSVGCPDVYADGRGVVRRCRR
jgi:hypothetical protein